MNAQRGAKERPVGKLKNARGGYLSLCNNGRAHLYPALHPPCKPSPQIKSAARLYRRSQKTHIEWTRMGRLAHRLTTYCNFARINRRQTYPARNRDGNQRTSKRRRRCRQRKTKNFPFFYPTADSLCIFASSGYPPRSRRKIIDKKRGYRTIFHKYACNMEKLQTLNARGTRRE